MQQKNKRVINCRNFQDMSLLANWRLTEDLLSLWSEAIPTIDEARPLLPLATAKVANSAYPSASSRRERGEGKKSGSRPEDLVVIPTRGDRGELGEERETIHCEDRMKPRLSICRQSAAGFCVLPRWKHIPADPITPRATSKLKNLIYFSKNK